LGLGLGLGLGGNCHKHQANRIDANEESDDDLDEHRQCFQFFPHDALLLVNDELRFLCNVEALSVPRLHPLKLLLRTLDLLERSYQLESAGMGLYLRVGSGFPGSALAVLSIVLQEVLVE
jgi:hypothetical protein